MSDELHEEEPVVEEVTAAVDEPPDHVPTFAAAEDPRAMAGIRRAKGIGGLAGFGLAALAAHQGGELLTSVLLRALAGGVVGYMVAWLAAVTVWRKIIRAELHHTVQTALAARASQPGGDGQ